MYRFRTIRRLVVVVALFCTAVYGEEGMYPINLLGHLDLRARGLHLDARDIYNPGGVGLIDAVVKFGGCTGSFVSPDGLIITNHHCVFGFVQAASTKDHDYVTDGFLAQSRAEEMPARGGTVRITESYRDVSADVTGAVSDTMSAAARAQAIGARIRTLVAEAEKANPGKRAEVSEMITGKSYLLFVFTLLRDVRVVYVPPRSIGEYGGDIDNWEWPRHTGDFSFVRAYVAPDGSPADYSPRNVPYHPRKYLKVQPDGVKNEDAVFILGYPGRTYRHRTSQYLAYEEDVRMPYTAALYDWQIATMLHYGASDRAIALKFDALVKGLANAAKNYHGKLLGMKRLNLVEKKKEEEQRFQKFVESDPARMKRYGTLLQDIGAVYGEMTSRAPYELTLDNLRSSSTLFSLASTIADARAGLRAAVDSSDTAAVRQTVARIRESVQNALRDFYEPADRALLREMIMRSLRLSGGLRIAPVDAIMESESDTSRAVETFLDDMYDHTKLKDQEAMDAVLDGGAEKLLDLEDPLVTLADSLRPLHQALRDLRRDRESHLSQLYARLVDAQQEFLKGAFIPDANSTLRFTCGHIRGYSPADATSYGPITTLEGVMEKSTGVEPFNPPAKLVRLQQAGTVGRFGLPGRKTVPVGLLYDLDTTGGNSGSPLLNAKGELVGVNFDRAYEATINDYTWSEQYSRSIAVDIRYVLWVTTEIGGAGYLLAEMGIKPAQ